MADSSDDKHFLLSRAVLSSDFQTVYVLLRQRASPNLRLENGNTCLHWAAIYGSLDIVLELIRYGGDVKARNGSQDTPLHWAALYGNTDVVKVLLKAGSEPSAANVNRSTPLHWAVKGGHLDAVKVLLEHGALADSKNIHGDTPVIVANALKLFAIRDLLQQSIASRAPTDPAVSPTTAGSSVPPRVPPPQGINSRPPPLVPRQQGFAASAVPRQPLPPQPQLRVGATVPTAIQPPSRVLATPIPPNHGELLRLNHVTARSRSPSPTPTPMGQPSQQVSTPRPVASPRFSVEQTASSGGRPRALSLQVPHHSGLLGGPVTAWMQGGHSGRSQSPRTTRVPRAEPIQQQQQQQQPQYPNPSRSTLGSVPPSPRLEQTSLPEVYTPTPAPFQGGYSVCGPYEGGYYSTSGFIPEVNLPPQQQMVFPSSYVAAPIMSSYQVLPPVNAISAPVAIHPAVAAYLPDYYFPTPQVVAGTIPYLQPMYTFS